MPDPGVIQVIQITPITEWIQIGAIVIQAIATIALVVVTIYYAIQTRKTVSAMEISSKNEFLPIIMPAWFALTSNERTLNIELKNVGKGLAKRPVKIIFPGVGPISVNSILPISIMPKDKQLATINYDKDYILSLDQRDRKMVIEYEDIFGRIVKTETILIEISRLGPNGNLNGIAWEVWSCALP